MKLLIENTKENPNDVKIECKDMNTDTLCSVVDALLEMAAKKNNIDSKKIKIDFLMKLSREFDKTPEEKNELISLK